MTNADPYSRLYWRFREEFPEIYADKPLFGWWASLLMIAEGAHPSAAELPRKISKASIEALVKAELVELLPGDRFRIRGVAKERARRAEAARVGGLASGRSRTVERPLNERSTDSEQTVDLDEQSKAETSKDETRITAPASIPVKGMNGTRVDVSLSDLQEDAPPKDAERLMKLAAELTGMPFVSPYTGLGLKAVNEQLPHGFSRVESAWRRIASQTAAAGPSKPTLRQLVFGGDDILNPVPQVDSKEQREDESRSAFDRRVERTRRELAELRGEK